MKVYVATDFSAPEGAKFYEDVKRVLESEGHELISFRTHGVIVDFSLKQSNPLAFKFMILEAMESDKNQLDQSEVMIFDMTPYKGFNDPGLIHTLGMSRISASPLIVHSQKGYKECSPFYSQSAEYHTRTLEDIREFVEYIEANL